MIQLTGRAILKRAGAGRGNGQYSVDPFVSRAFPLLGDQVVLDIHAEAFNIFNHANFVGNGGTYGNGDAPGVGFGAHPHRRHVTITGTVDAVFGEG